MIWLAPYVGLRPEAAVLSLWQFARPGLLQHNCAGDDYMYGDVLRHCWAQCREFGDDLAVVEHDIVIRQDVRDAFLDCPEPYCAFPYAWTTTVGPALGCTRFRHELLDAYPTAVQEALEIPSAYGKPGHWRQLDVYLMRNVLWRRYRLAPHCHLPPVEHLNPAQQLVPGAPTEPVLDMAVLDGLGA